MGNKPSYSHKSAARLAAVQILYQLELSGDDSLNAVEEFKEYHINHIIEDSQDKNINWTLANQLVAGIIKHKTEINTLISEALAKDWRFERLELLIRCILQAASFELFTFPEQPIALIMAEYLKITESFYTEKEVKFVNGILHTIASQIREIK